jgi:hypothetical protein
MVRSPVILQLVGDNLDLQEAFVSKSSRDSAWLPIRIRGGNLDKSQGVLGYRQKGMRAKVMNNSSYIVLGRLVCRVLSSGVYDA